MAKKRRKSSNRKVAVSPPKLDKAILENLVALQKIHTGLAEKFDKLAGEISQLLGLFEATAKSFTKNAVLGEYEKDKEFLEKIDKLLDQNKTLAKGLTLMEERLRERMYGVPSYTEHNHRSDFPEREVTEIHEEGREPRAESFGRPLPHF